MCPSSSPEAGNFGFFPIIGSEASSLKKNKFFLAKLESIHWSSGKRRLLQAKHYSIQCRRKGANRRAASKLVRPDVLSSHRSLLSRKT